MLWKSGRFQPGVNSSFVDFSLVLCQFGGFERGVVAVRWISIWSYGSLVDFSRVLWHLVVSAVCYYSLPNFSQEV